MKTKNRYALVLEIVFENGGALYYGGDDWAKLQTQALKEASRKNVEHVMIRMTNEMDSE